MDLLTEIFRETPWWVYLIFLLLFLLGLKALKTRTLSIRQLFLIPITLTALNFFWLNERIQGHSFYLLFWVAGLILGSFWGWFFFKKLPVQVHRTYSLTIPPTPSTLVLIVLFFLVRYFFIYNSEKHPESPFSSLDALSSGIMTGFFIGRALKLMDKYKKHL